MWDIIIVGAGPAGLCLAKSLAGSGLRIAIVEQQAESAVANPAFDGREIALTHHSVKLLKDLDVFSRLPSEDVSPLRDASVFNGPSLYAMTIEHSDAGRHHGRPSNDDKPSQLGYLVANHLIRKAAYEVVKAAAGITLITGVGVKGIHTDANCASITLSDGEALQSKLIVAADSRFSETRRAMGISANMHDFGKTMMVCVMTHEKPHHHVAWEWFDYGQTLALLPMNGNRSSVVVTLPAHDIQALMQLSEDAFNQAMQSRFQLRLGQMHLASTRHAYPLVTVYPDRFVANRFALVGDAAVGMHPVTAHGFNFGLRSIEALANEIKAARRSGQEIANPVLLARYERTHKRATRPLFLATHAIAKLYSDNTLPARLIRQASLRIGNRITPFKRAMAEALMERH